MDYLVLGGMLYVLRKDYDFIAIDYNIIMSIFLPFFFPKCTNTCHNANYR